MDDVGIDAADLARAVGIAQSTIERALKGEIGLSFVQLQKVGRYFGRTPLFFLEAGEANPDAIRSPQFRSLSNQRHRLDQRLKNIVQLVEWQRQAYIDLLLESDESDLIEFNPPRLVGLSPALAAQAARHWLGVQSENTFGLYRSAVERRGVLVFRTNGYSGKWQLPSTHAIIGFSLFHEQYPIIVVRKENVEARQTFTLAHELGHLLLFRESTIDSEESLTSHAHKERAANAFAGHFLVPQSRLEEIDLDSLSTEPEELEAGLSAFRRSWGVSTDVILLRLIQSELLPHAVYNDFTEWRRLRQDEVIATRGSRSWRHREPHHILGDTYVRNVLQALSAKRLTLVKASKYLDDLKLSDIRKLEKYIVGH